jgi:hypothetical protein
MNEEEETTQENDNGIEEDIRETKKLYWSHLMKNYNATPYIDVAYWPNQLITLSN